MRVVFIGCVEFSKETLHRLLSERTCEVVGIVTRGQSAFNADFASLEGLALEAGLPYFLAEGNDQDAMADWISARRPDVIYCFGWSYLLKERILSLAPKGVVGYHPAALPRNRGRHPIIWALALGLRETASTFFLMDGGADSGDILSQEPVAIGPMDDAAALYRSLTETAHRQISSFTRELREGTARPLPQDPALANTWRKRGKADGQVDWRMGAWAIHNLVRALARPYVGAHCIWEGREIKIWKARPRAAGDLGHLEPGKVVAHEGSILVVKCGEGALEILEHGFNPLPPMGSYL